VRGFVGMGEGESANVWNVKLGEGGMFVFIRINLHDQYRDIIRQARGRSYLAWASNERLACPGAYGRGPQ